jgi:hypothetical protein
MFRVRALVVSRGHISSNDCVFFSSQLFRIIAIVVARGQFSDNGSEYFESQAA